MDYKEYEIFKEKNKRKKKKFEQIFGLGAKHLYEGKEVMIIGFDENTNYKALSISPIIIGGEIIGHYPLILITSDKKNYDMAKNTKYAYNILPEYEDSYYYQWARMIDLTQSNK